MTEEEKIEKLLKSDDVVAKMQNDGGKDYHYLDEKLLPCPFCGGKAEIYAQAWNKYSVICAKCFCVKGSYGTEEKAIEEWNKRVSEVEK